MDNKLLGGYRSYKMIESDIEEVRGIETSPNTTTEDPFSVLTFFILG